MYIDLSLDLLKIYEFYTVHFLSAGTFYHVLCPLTKQQKKESIFTLENLDIH